MDNVLHSVRIREITPPVRGQQAPPARQVPPAQQAPKKETMQPARTVHGFAPGKGSQGILQKAQASLTAAAPPAYACKPCICAMDATALNTWDACS